MMHRYCMPSYFDQALVRSTINDAKGDFLRIINYDTACCVRPMFTEEQKHEEMNMIRRVNADLRQTQKEATLMPMRMGFGCHLPKIHADSQEQWVGTEAYEIKRRGTRLFLAAKNVDTAARDDRTNTQFVESLIRHNIRRRGTHEPEVEIDWSGSHIVGFRFKQYRPGQCPK